MVPFTSLHCQRCGAPVAADVRFCPSCGQRQGVADPGGREDDPLLARVRAALLNEYDVEREVGRGGMAAVFLANDLRLPRRVALKVMLPELAYHSAMPQRFVAEARTAAMLDHPNIVPVFHAGEQDGLRYFAMRFIDGCSLEQLQRAHGGLPVGLACHILAEVAAALAYAHAQGVVHRDVKPSNVMIDRAWARAIVTDFGIARIADGQRLTSTGLAIGTPEYMSPEQYSNDHLTGASDQYALGAVAYQLLAGRPPFLGTQAEVLVAHLREPPPALRTLRPEVPLAVETLVARMLAKAPEDRWPSLAELATRFGEHVDIPPATLRQQLIALVPARAPGEGLPRTPASPDPPSVDGASVAVPVGPLPDEPLPDASPTSALDAAPRLRATAYTPRGVIPIRPTPPALASADGEGTMAGVEEDDPLLDVLDVEDVEDVEELADGEAPSPALEQHRAWLHTDAGVAPAPQPRRSLFVGIGALAALVAAVLLVMRDTRVERTAAATPDGARPDAPTPTEANAGEVARLDSAALRAARDSAARRDSIARLIAARLVVIDGAPRGRPLDLPRDDSVRLRARVVDGRRSAIADVRPVRWQSSAPTVVTVSPDGVVRALAESGEATITASIDTMQRTLRVRATRRPQRAIGPNPDSARPAAAAPSLAGEQALRLVAAVTEGIPGPGVDALRRLFDAAPGGAPSADRLFETLRRERDVRVEVVGSGVDGAGGEHPTMPVQLKLSWKRGGLGKLKGARDHATADVLARFDRAGAQWRLAALQLARPYRP